MQKERLKYSAGMIVGCFRLLSFNCRKGMTNYWDVECINCHTTYIRPVAQLNQRQSKGCPNCSKGTTTHGKAATKKDPTYISWSRMWQRIRGTDPNALITYAHVTIDPRWESFVAFYEDMGERPTGTTLDRIDSFKGYSKDNCRWATAKEQARNKTDTILLTFDGKTKPLVEWADLWGLDHRLVRERYRRQGYRSIQDLSKPPAKRRKHGKIS